MPGHAQAMIDALRARDVAAAETILRDHPAVATHRGHKGESLAIVALFAGAEELARRLAAAPDLREAAALGDMPRLTKLLAEADAETIEARGSDGWTALHLAAFFGRAEAVLALLEAGADPRAVSANATANTPLHAALAGRAGLQIVDALLARGADAGAVAGAGVTPLHLAAKRGDAALVKRLLARGADPRAAMTTGRTPADVAGDRGFMDLSIYLRRARRRKPAE
ncbi:MAG: ankyrin repeat domain-containing protein [Candidatus Polarisedimenticolia bacterium]|nr:ankyrin repeat domain-containing protein [bacterium]